MSKPSTPVIAGMKPVPGTRGAITFDMARCDECQDCERVCPSVAIKVYPEEKKIAIINNILKIYGKINAAGPPCRVDISPVDVNVVLIILIGDLTRFRTSVLVPLKRLLNKKSLMTA